MGPVHDSTTPLSYRLCSFDFARGVVERMQGTGPAPGHAQLAPKIPPGDRHSQSATLPTTGESDDLDDDLSPLVYVDDVDARCSIPVDWIAQPLKRGANNKHQIWLSPTRHTAFGVLAASLPFPAALLPISTRRNATLEGFLREMKRKEGRSELLESHEDPLLPGVRFIAEGGQYKVSASLIVHGSKAWFIYVGTQRDLTVVPEEVRAGEHAREATKVGMKIDCSVLASSKLLLQHTPSLQGLAVRRAGDNMSYSFCAAHHCMRSDPDRVAAPDRLPGESSGGPASTDRASGTDRFLRPQAGRINVAAKTERGRSEKLGTARSVRPCALFSRSVARALDSYGGRGRTHPVATANERRLGPVVCQGPVRPEFL